MKIKILMLTEKGKNVISQMRQDYTFQAKMLFKMEINDNLVIIEPRLKPKFAKVVLKLPLDQLQKETKQRWVKTMIEYGLSKEDYSLEVTK